MHLQEAYLSGEATSGPLSSKNYAALDELLGKTDMYSQFLLENLETWQKEIETQPEAEAAEAEPEAPKGKAGTKRKAGKAGGKNSKKQKPLTATQVSARPLKQHQSKQA